MSETDKTEDEEGVDAQEVEAGLESLMREDAKELLDQDSASGIGDPFAQSDSEGSPGGSPFETPDAVEDAEPTEAARPSQFLGEEEEAELSAAFEFQKQDLDQRALDAANFFVDDAAESSAEEEASAEVAVTARRRSMWDVLMPVLLLSNLCLMGWMVALPGGLLGSKDRPEQVPVEVDDSVANPVAESPDPFVTPRQELDELLPSKPMYDAARLEVIGENYERAVELFEGYLAAHPELRPFQKQMVFNTLAYCLQKVGRREEALAVTAKIEDLVRLTSLPDELWKMAQLAEADGRGNDMRRYYARFLLQQDQLGVRWTDQGKVIEAYLKIGDSYRVDAGRDLQADDFRSQLDSKLKRAAGATSGDKKNSGGDK